MNKIVLPQAAVLELTYRCNHQCIFCSCPWDAPVANYKKGMELDVDQWKMAVSKLYDRGIVAFSLSGGEVLLKDGFEEIIRHIRMEGNKRNLNHEIVLISNGRNMKEEYLKLFKENNVHLSMSLPGLTTFKEHTGVDNAEGVLRWFQIAKSYGLRTTVNVTVTKKNINELFETLSMGLLNGADDALINRFLPGGRGLAHRSELELSVEDVNTMLDTVEEVLQLARRYGNVGTEVARCAIRNPEKYKKLSMGYKCAAAKGFFVVDPSGNVRTCNHSPRIVGHIFHDDIITDIEYWNTFAFSDYHPESCKGCKHISQCDCGCREVANILYGSPLSTDTTIVPGFRN